MPRLRPVVLLVSALLMTVPASAQDDWGEETACAGVLDDAGRLAAVLAQVPKYGSTYVLALAAGQAESVAEIESPALRDLRVGVYAGSPAVALAATHQIPVTTYALADGGGKIVEDLLAGALDAAILWSPLAGLGGYELDFDYALTFRTAGPPAAPPALAGAAAPAEGDLACAEEIAGLLEGYGVVPAEKLVPLDIRDLIALEPPSRDLAEARRGAPLYAEHCAKCHGPEAVAARDQLAPVDLLVSVRRFTFPGFLYIALNGRPRNGMPRFRGSLEREQIELIYRYVRERSHGEIPATAPP